MNVDDRPWFSCSLRFAEFTDDAAFFRYRTSLYLLRADDHVNARRRALEIGRGQERIYRNANESLVRIALVEVETLDMLGEIEDGTEVCHWPSEEADQPPVAWDHQFHPEDSTFYTTL